MMTAYTYFSDLDESTSAILLYIQVKSFTLDLEHFGCKFLFHLALLA